jgi:hypothetical protein
MGDGKLRLERATPENRLFSELDQQWREQLGLSEDAPEDYYRPMMQHASRIATESPQDPRYGIFILSERQDGGQRIFEGLVHINHAFPGSQYAIVRMVWNLIAPRYQFEDFRPEQLARIKTAFIMEGLALCIRDMPSHELKVYLGNAIDREYAAIAAAFIESQYPEYKFAVRGSWLHVAVQHLGVGA